MKRIIMVVMCVLLASTLFAAGGQEEKTAAEEGGDVQLHWIIRDKLVDEAKDRAVAQVKEDLGIDLKLDVIDANVWEEKINVIFAASDYPDMFKFTDSNLDKMQLGMEAGIYYDVTDYVSSSPIYSDVDKKRFSMLSDSGNIYGLPTRIGYPLVIFARDDWMNNLDMQDPSSIEGFRELVTAFSENDPDGNGKDDTAGFSWVGIEGWSAPYWKMFLPDVPGVFYVDEATGEIKNTAYLVEDVKTALAFFRDLYAAGAMDKNWISDKKSDVESKYINGKIGLWEKGAQYGSSRQSKMDAVGDGGIVGVLKPINGKYGPNYSTFIDSGNPVFIMEKYEHKEKALELIEYWVTGEWFTAYQLGEKGKDWSVQDGEVVYADSVDESLHLYNAGLWIELISGVEPPAIDPQLSAILEEVEGFNVVENAKPFVQKSESFDRNVALQSMRDEIVSEIILGVKPVSAYDAFLEEYKKAGADEILRQANELKK